MHFQFAKKKNAVRLTHFGLDTVTCVRYLPLHASHNSDNLKLLKSLWFITERFRG